LKLLIRAYYTKIITCCSIYNFIHLDQKCVTITTRDPNVSDPPNVQQYNDSNQVATDQFSNEIAEMFHRH